MISVARCICFFAFLMDTEAVIQVCENGDAAVCQGKIDLLDDCHTQSVRSLLSALTEKDSKTVAELLEAEWQPSAEVFIDLFVALDATSDNEYRFALEQAISRSMGATREKQERAKNCVDAVKTHQSRNVRRIAEYYSDFMFPYDFTDEQNCERLRFTNNEQDSLRWLSLRHLSFCRRYYQIETSPQILSRIIPRSPKMVVPCLIDQLNANASEAVQLVSLEGLWWYYSMGQFEVSDFRKILVTVQDGGSSKLAVLAASYEAKIDLSGSSSKQSRGEHK